ncbi:hypothetical protein K439DRAFT_961991 [Ramaria rubella]|nr:hypothetical protein K439DRAFT_961991 [Ramaria rubella]
MQQEQDTCRICSGPGEPDQPLFYPCKCSGTIRYIHQDCLKTWLDHSKKSTCDVCKHPYAFTKVYAPNMPDRVPITIIVRKFAEQVIAVILFMLRAMVVAFVWLTLLPYGTVLAWRLYFRMGDILAWWISLHPRPTHTSSPSALNASLRIPPNNSVSLNGSTPLQQPRSDVFIQLYLRNLSTDIFTGQIIASLIVLAFLAVFLLREWIQQNARPGVFDDGPAPELPALVEAQAQADPLVADPAPENVVDDHEFQDNDADALPIPDVPEDVRTAGPSSSSSSSSDTEGPSARPTRSTLVDPLPAFGRRKSETRSLKRVRGIPSSAQRRGPEHGDDSDTKTNFPSRRFKKKNGEFSRWEVGSASSRGSSRNGQRVIRDSKDRSSGSPLIEEGNTGRSSSSPELVAPLGSKAREKRKADDPDTEGTDRYSSDTSSSHRSLSPTAGFEFTFKPPPSSSGDLSRFPATLPLPQNGDFKFKPRPRSFSQPSLPSASVVDHPSRSAQSSSPQLLPLGLKYSLHHEASSALRSSTPRSSSPHPPLFTRNLEDSPPIAPLLTLAPRRPPLPASILPSSEHINAEASSSTARDKASTPLASPHLAIYRPPEELEADDTEYFGDTLHAEPAPHDADEEDEEEDHDRFAYYFREPEQEDVKETVPPLLPDTDDDDDEEDVHEVHDGEEPPEDVGAQQPQDIRPAARERAGQEVDADAADEERDLNLEEDLDGAMEAVGLRGPIFAVFQNAALMLFILNVSIGGGVWIPFTLGKTVALLTLEPRRTLQIIHLPIRAVRLVTDPSVDAVIYCLRSLGFYMVALSKVSLAQILRQVDILPGTKHQEWLSALFQRADNQNMLSYFVFVGDETAANLRDGDKTWILRGTNLLWYYLAKQSEGSPVPLLLSSASESSIFRFVEDGFAILGRFVRVTSGAALKEWVELAEGDGTLERIWAIFLGYAIAAFFAALYLNTITVGNMKSAGRAVRNAIRQQMIVLKVALFIVVELVMFPFGCGVMLDLSTVILFPDASVETRVAFFLYAPVTTAFYHWLIGTMFMYQFAILLANCRDILRPGCMWFIKDPQDPTFHPIRDILDRPTFAQLRKLCMSAIMYAVVISLGVGGVVWSLTTVAPSILPLRWKMREPLSEIPVDLLFVHLILPPTLHYFRPRKPVRRLMTAWWQWTARQLRLTSFMFGGRHPQEEIRPLYRSWRSLLTGDTSVVAAEDGSFRRAPAGDNIAFLRDRPTLVQVDEDGEPVDADGRDIIAAQNAEAQQAGRNHRDDYTVVYVPPNFRRRIFLFIFLFWASGSIAMVSSVSVPILAGRAILKLCTPRELHDGYSFIIGFYLLWWAWLVGSLMARIRIRRQRHGGGRRIRASWFLFLFKRVSVYMSKIIWLAFWLGIILPTLVSIAVDLYLVIPLRYFMNPDFTPTIHIFESWATGLIISKIIMRTQRARPGNDLGGALEAIQRNGWRRPDPLAATKDFIIPVGTGLIGMILLPPMVVYAGSRIITLPWQLEDLFRLIYPSIFVIVAVAQFAMSLIRVFTKWTQGIRDKEFLIELRLRNLDHPRKTEKIEPIEPLALESSGEQGDEGLADED